ncbi:FAD dependent oxidoreductase protein [Rutstroemia sp. NJR-2017a BBW]|nr:FAD dependent oxidoreductase protein [Rutstroemia sp. NJR-2017a BBW]
MATPTTTSYLIVGSGVFGTSTAYHLSIAHPGSSITVLDRSSTFPCPLGASYDYNKIIRADYGNIFYCELALKAREAWKINPLFKPYYHESGLVNVDDTGLGRRIIANYDKLGVQDHQARIVRPDVMKEEYGGLFRDADWTGAEDVFVNEGSGWAEATRALRAVTETAKLNGVQFLQGDVDGLLIDENSCCDGVRMRDGTVLKADRIILSTGAGTASLLADSAPQTPDIQAADRITAAAVVVGHIKLNPEQYERFKHTPVFIHALNADDYTGEVLPPTPDGILKFCVDVSFKNTLKHDSSRQLISAPPAVPDQAQNVVPASMQGECRRVMKGIYGREVDDLQFDSFRICWDGITPNQDFIISSHPRCQRLFIATGGSFHGWKFLPIIGEYVVKLLDGTLEEDLVRKWAWDREQHGSAHEKIVPKRELKDLK